MLGEVVVHAQRVLALEQEVLAHRRAGVRRHPLHRRRLVRGSGDDDRVVHRAGVLQPLVDLLHGRRLLPDCDVDADEVLAALVEHRVHEQGGLADGAVADDQLALAAADGDHRVDCLDARLHGLLHRLAVDDARRLELERPSLRGRDRRAAVHGLAQRVDDTADQLLADGDARDAAGAPHRLALLHVRPVAEQRRADVVLLEVEGDTGDAVLELDHLHGDRALEAVDARDAVTHLEHGADLGEVGLDCELLDALLEDGGDLFRA